MITGILFMMKVICGLLIRPIKIKQFGVSFSGFTDYKTRKANRVTFDWSYKNQNSSYWEHFIEIRS